ncbi:hypothetical protein [Flavobacterium sp.]|uniref:hypothetical protein n=1 Tax=Flavobacterium sp. TaxID=239 RepID=UPI003752983F
MKNYLLIFFLIFCYQVSSQDNEKKIIFKDDVTNLPIEDVSVFIMKTKQILLSNSQGMVGFVLSGASNIQISHSSYKQITIRSNTLKEVDNIIYLKNIINELEEIIITKRHPQLILKGIIVNSIKKLTVPARLKVYCREFFKVNGDYSCYNDGLMNFQILGNKKDFKTDVLVEQNRTFGLIDDKISNDLLGYNLNNIMENYYNFKYLNIILEPKAKKEYDFVLKGYSANKDYYLMTVTPTDEIKGLLDTFTILYDTKKKIIIEVSSTLDPSRVAQKKDKTSVGSKNLLKSYFKSIYRLDDDNYYLVSSKEEIGFERIEKKRTIKIEVKNYFVTTNFSNQSYTYSESEVFKDKTLFNKKNVILSNYWNLSGLVATDEEQEIINNIPEE